MTHLTHRTITLTGRRPVSIAEDEWPIIAAGTWRHHDGQPEVQANRKWLLQIRVRQHQDGRAIVYGGVYDYDTHWQNEDGFVARVGMLCGAGDDLPSVIAAIGIQLRARLEDAQGRAAEGMSHIGSVVAECIAELPAETL